MGKVNLGAGACGRPPLHEEEDATMGYSTCGLHGSRTCDACDSCPKCYGYRMHWVRCPVNWCGTTTLCPACHQKHGPIRHETCRISSAQYKAETARRAEAEGELIRQKPL